MAGKSNRYERKRLDGYWLTVKPHHGAFLLKVVLIPFLPIVNSHLPFGGALRILVFYNNALIAVFRCHFR
nr:MAG TPA: hypothetical protein [Caudoviricetes sp.]